MMKNKNGWKATTEIFLGDVLPDTKSIHGKGGKRFLRLSTSKPAFDKGLVTTTASGYLEQDSGHGYKSELHAVGMGTGAGDYYKTVQKLPRPRITEKTIKEAHEQALAMWPEIIETAKVEG
jgi:hypothetical protein